MCYCIRATVRGTVRNERARMSDREEIADKNKSKGGTEKREFFCKYSNLSLKKENEGVLLSIGKLEHNSNLKKKCYLALKTLRLAAH